ncbi:MAG TPA: diguanylate cyclase, partial [Anaerolineaceae bacterium]|nr:diguanylate cyclase [Anaerolineaceae bacterium]
FQIRLATSVLSGEEENQIKINFLIPLVLFTLLFVVFSAIIALISKSYTILLAFLISAVILFTALELLRNGTLKLPAILFVVQGYLFLSFSLLFQGSEPTLRIVGIGIFLLITGVLFKPKILILAIAYSFISIFSLLKEIIPPILPAPSLPEWYTAWVSPIFMIALLGLLAFLMQRAIHHSLQIAKQANSERYHIENEEKKFKSIAQHSLSSLLITDADGNIEYVNSKFSEWMGYSSEEVLGKNPRMFKSEFTPVEFHENLWKTITRGKTWVGEFVNLRKDESVIYLATKIEPLTDQISGKIHYVAYQQDISQPKKLQYELDESNQQLQEQVEKLAQQEKQHQELAQHDRLTDLYHREHLYEILPREFLRTTRAQKHLIMLLIYVDQFQTINQGYGHQAGNCVLKTITKRMSDALGPNDIVFRSGGDEFVALIPVNPGETGVTQAEQLHESLTKQPIDCENHSILLTVSIGIAIYPIHGKSIDALLGKAENALTRAKASGGNRISLWSQNGEE